MRVIITGSRSHQEQPWDQDAILTVVNDIMHNDNGPVTIVHGGAPGADAMASLIAYSTGWVAEVHPARWKRYGRKAGSLRNAEMVHAGAEACIAFPDHRKGQGSWGTWNCVSQAHAAGIPVFIVWNKTLFRYTTDTTVEQWAL